MLRNMTLNGLDKYLYTHAKGLRSRLLVSRFKDIGSSTEGPVERPNNSTRQ
jgi:hypothetical protein